MVSINYKGFIYQEDTNSKHEIFVAQEVEEDCFKNLTLVGEVFIYGRESKDFHVEIKMRFDS